MRHPLTGLGVSRHRSSPTPAFQMVCLTGEGLERFHTSGRRTIIRFRIRGMSVFCQLAEGRMDRKCQLQTFLQAKRFLKNQTWKLRNRKCILLKLLKSIATVFCSSPPSFSLINTGILAWGRHSCKFLYFHDTISYELVSSMSTRLRLHSSGWQTLHSFIFFFIC